MLLVWCLVGCFAFFLIIPRFLSIRTRQCRSSSFETWRPTATPMNGKLLLRGIKKHRYRVSTTFAACCTESLQSQLPDSFPYVQGLMDGVLQGIMEEAQTMTRTLGTVYAEYRLHYGDSCEYVGIWKCTMLPHQPKKENIMNGKR